MKKLQLKKDAYIRAHLSWTICDIIENIINRTDDIDDDADETEALLQSCDDELIYTADQWAIIAEYSSPSEPLAFCEAFECFFDTLCAVVEFVEI